MKTIFTLLLSSIFSIASFAYDGPLLTVSSVGNQKIFVEVDGSRYAMNNDNTVTIRNIYPGTHTVRVLREMKNRSGWNLRIGSRREEVIYAIRATLRNGYDFDIVVNRFGKIMLDERRMDPNDDLYGDDDDYYDNNRNNDEGYDNSNNRNDRDRNWDKNPNGRNNNDERYDNRNGTKDDRYDDSNNKNDRDNRYYEMNDADFSQAKESLRKEWFENTRLNTAKQIIDRNYFTSRQVRDLMLLFTFENNRLDVAKYAYNKVVDKGNYFMVNEALSSTSKKEELNNFIHDQQ